MPVTVRPQGSSPYKKVGHYAGSVPHTSSPGPVKNKTTLEEPAKLQVVDLFITIFVLYLLLLYY